MHGAVGVGAEKLRKLHSDMTYGDPREQNERGAERDAANLDASKRDADCNDESEGNDEV